MEPKKLTREQVEQIVRKAWERQERPDLSGATLNWADLSAANFRGANFRGADLFGANLSRADLRGANLRKANLSGADLIKADLTLANLEEADLSGANLSGQDLSRADLSGANLSGAELNETELDGANFSNAIIKDTSFIEVDLSQAKGLTEVDHQGPSIIDINTIYQSKDKIPAIFLEKAGVHPDIIRWQHSLHTRPTVFISYSRKDEKEKDELLVHLRALEREDLLTVWHDGLIGPGADWKQGIKGAIAQASVVILLITPNFLASEFILAKEIPEFLERQKSEEGLIIFPILAKPCAWSRVGWLQAIQLRPKGGQPIWAGDTNVDTELSKIADEVVEIIKDRWLRRD